MDSLRSIDTVDHARRRERIALQHPHEARPRHRTASVGLVPRLHRYNEQLRLPVARSVALRRLHAAVTVVTTLFASVHTAAVRTDLDRIIGGPPELSTETQDLPGSWRTSHMQPAPLFDPGRTFARRPNNARRYCARISIRRTLQTIVLSRLDHAAVALPVYASQRRSPDDHATLGPGWWPPFPDGGRYAARFV